MRHKPVIGLIGGIGAGKSLVAGMLASLGGRVISGDQIGHDALRQPKLAEQAIAEFGEEIHDSKGGIDRRRLGAIVFGNARKRQALERIVHPWIRERLHEEVMKAQEDPAARMVVVDAAIMLEAGWDGVCDHLVYVDAPRHERLRRVASQRGWSAEQVQAREQAQMSLEEKKLRADATIDNSGPPELVAGQIALLLKKWRISTILPSNCPPAQA